jgi:hypothetical protein
MHDLEHRSVEAKTSMAGNKPGHDAEKVDDGEE